MTAMPTSTPVERWSRGGGVTGASLGLSAGEQQAAGAGCRKAVCCRSAVLPAPARHVLAAVHAHAPPSLVDVSLSLGSNRKAEGSSSLTATYTCGAAIGGQQIQAQRRPADRQQLHGGHTYMHPGVPAGGVAQSASGEMAAGHGLSTAAQMQLATSGALHPVFLIQHYIISRSPSCQQPGRTRWQRTAGPAQSMSEGQAMGGDGRSMREGGRAGRPLARRSNTGCRHRQRAAALLPKESRVTLAWAAL